MYYTYIVYVTLPILSYTSTHRTLTVMGHNKNTRLYMINIKKICPSSLMIVLTIHSNTVKVK